MYSSALSTPNEVHLDFPFVLLSFFYPPPFLLGFWDEISDVLCNITLLSDAFSICSLSSMQSRIYSRVLFFPLSSIHLPFQHCLGKAWRNSQGQTHLFTCDCFSWHLSGLYLCTGVLGAAVDPYKNVGIQSRRVSSFKAIQNPCCRRFCFNNFSLMLKSIFWVHLRSSYGCLFFGFVYVLILFSAFSRHIDDISNSRAAMLWNRINAGSCKTKKRDFNSLIWI